MDSESPDIAIIYWFYKELEVTKNHLVALRKSNPNAQIFGVFGGDEPDIGEYKESLVELDDFWFYPGTYGKSAKEKWIHGDLMLLDWYDKRGRDLKWDSVGIVQWDMLLFEDIRNITPGIKKGEMFFSGYRNLDSELEARWSWTRSDYDDPYNHPNYSRFKKYIFDTYNHTGALKACLFIYEVLTKDYFEMLLRIEDKKTGFLEYKHPTLAYLEGFNIFNYNIGVFWKEEYESSEKAPLNAMKTPISTDYIKNELSKSDGWRMFHPYEELWTIKE